MKIEIEAKGLVNKGQFIIKNKKEFADRVIEAFPDQKIRIVVMKDWTLIHDKMRKYYFGPMLGHLKDAFKDHGMIESKSDLDQRMRRMFLAKEEYDEASGEIIRTPRSLSKDSEEVSNEEFREYIDQIIRFAAEHLDYGIPYPNEY